MSSFQINFKRNSQFKQEFFIGKDENKIKTLEGAEYVRGYSRARRRQAVRKVSKDLRVLLELE